jgi:hypothetical protein
MVELTEAGWPMVEQSEAGRWMTELSEAGRSMAERSEDGWLVAGHLMVEQSAVSLAEQLDGQTSEATYNNNLQCIQ